MSEIGATGKEEREVLPAEGKPSQAEGDEGDSNEG
jgi:hypothetical protein